MAAFVVLLLDGRGIGGGAAVFTVFAAAVDQDRKLHLARPAKVHQLVESRTDRSAGVEHVVNEDDILALNVVLEFGAVNYRVCSDRREVITIKRYINYPVEGTVPFEGFDLVNKPFGKRYTAAPDPNNVKVVGALI